MSVRIIAHVTEAIYHDDAYVKGFEARVLEAGPDGVRLDRTAFYPGGGGQPADAGRLTWAGGSAIVETLKRGPAGPWHVLPAGTEPPPAGTIVQGELDWERRHALMRAHTALHILCGVIWRDFAAPVTGGSMDVGQARMDFELESMSADFAADIEAKINAEIDAARPILVRVLPRAEAFAIPDLIRTKINLLPPEIEHVRTVEIVGLDLQADGGTHVSNTRHVGRISVVGHESKGRINKRLRIAIVERGVVG
jgi:misacylated tRNA(Ala) deacylase